MLYVDNEYNLTSHFL